MFSIRNDKKWCSTKCCTEGNYINRNRKCITCNCLLKKSTAIKCKRCASKSMVRYWGDKISASKVGRKNSSSTKFKKGEEHPNWRGGRSPERSRRIGLQAYKDWRRSVFSRDNYTCVMCFKKGVPIHADHIKPYALFPELELDLKNGRTLCVPCHRQTPTWGFSKKYMVKIKDTTKS